MTHYTYFIMDDSFRQERKHPPMHGMCSDSSCYILGKRGLTILKERTYNDVERTFLEEQADRLESFEWAYNMVYLMQQSCGHYELFQTHVNSEKEALQWLDLMAKEAETRKCTRCTCCW